jgi:hypothetical protein
MMELRTNISLSVASGKFMRFFIVPSTNTDELVTAILTIRVPVVVVLKSDCKFSSIQVSKIQALIDTKDQPSQNGT